MVSFFFRTMAGRAPAAEAVRRISANPGSSRSRGSGRIGCPGVVERRSSTGGRQKSIRDAPSRRRTDAKHSLQNCRGPSLVIPQEGSRQDEVVASEGSLASPEKPAGAACGRPGGRSLGQCQSQARGKVRLAEPEGEERPGEDVVTERREAGAEPAQCSSLHDGLLVPSRAQTADQPAMRRQEPRESPFEEGVVDGWARWQCPQQRVGDSLHAWWRLSPVRQCWDPDACSRGRTRSCSVRKVDATTADAEQRTRRAACRQVIAYRQLDAVRREQAAWCDERDPPRAVRQVDCARVGRDDVQHAGRPEEERQHLTRDRAEGQRSSIGARRTRQWLRSG